MRNAIYTCAVLFRGTFVCLLLNGTSSLFRLLVPRTVEIEHMRHVKTICDRHVFKKKNIFNRQVAEHNLGDED